MEPWHGWKPLLNDMTKQMKNMSTIVVVSCSSSKESKLLRTRILKNLLDLKLPQTVKLAFLSPAWRGLFAGKLPRGPKNGLTWDMSQAERQFPQFWKALNSRADAKAASVNKQLREAQGQTRILKHALFYWTCDQHAMKRWDLHMFKSHEESGDADLDYRFWRS